jgi:hypothetical protein
MRRDYSSRRAARHAARRAARRRVLHLRHASGCLGTSRGSSRGSSSTTSTTPRVWVPQHVARLVTLLSITSTMPRVWVPRHVTRLVAPLVVDYFAYATRPSASARRAARRRLLRLRRASGCLGTSRGSTSTTSPTTRIRVPRHVAWLVIDYFAYAARPGASARRATRLAARRRLRVRRDFVLRPHWLYFSHMVHRDYLSRGNTGSTSGTSCATVTSSSSRIASTIHLD